MPKLTPKEAFEHLQAVFPWIVRLEKSSVYTDGLFFRDPQGHGFGFHQINIDWGDATSYKPERWRPATIEDVKRALDEPFECRASGEGGFVLAGGYIKADGKLVFEVRKEGCTTREPSGNVEVLDA